MKPLVLLMQDRRGVTVVEFAVIAPVLLTLLLGGFDVAHTLYVRSALQGVVQKAARDSTLEAYSKEDQQTILDNRVRAGVMALASNADLTFSRRYFRTFSAIGKAENLYDTNDDDKCDNGEKFDDDNGNGVWDADGGNSQGGAKDRAVYTVTMSYPRMFPPLFFWASPTTTVQAVTILANQPYSDQGTDTEKTGHCP